MRHRSSITSLSWIPSEAVEGSTRLAFETGLAHYDDPPTLLAVTPCKVAAVEAAELDRDALQLSHGHRRTQPDRS
jgi:hypothetical protein